MIMLSYHPPSISVSNTLMIMTRYIACSLMRSLSRVKKFTSLMQPCMKKADSLNDHLAKWSILLSCYDIRYNPTKAIKGQALANFLAKHPLSQDSKFKYNFPNKPVFFTEKVIKHTVDLDLHWIMYFDGATQTNEVGETVSGVEIIFCSPGRVYIPRSFSLLEPCSNNVA